VAVVGEKTADDSDSGGGERLQRGFKGSPRGHGGLGD